MIRTVLVANRGEIARRVFRTCRRLGIRTVAIYSDADVHAPFVSEADEAVRLGPAEPSESYLAIDRIVQAALTTRADAVHPGYGFLSENAGFAEACSAADLIFLGPPPEAIRTMGSKLESKRLMEAAGVPTLPSVELTVDVDPETEAKAIGFPLLVKASAGGGGKGMRIVESLDGLAPAIEGARREAVAAFGDGTLFLERFLDRPRHVEFQVFGDTHGNVVSLNERECSIQRRHQKVIEEAPSVAVDEDLRGRMAEAAVAAAKAVSYVGAGTVEFLLEAGGTFSFLEMNTRLQVEHPVTEVTTTIDLVQMQIDVAQGLDLTTLSGDLAPRGHAIEARLYAEDPGTDYLPTTGTVHRFDIDDSVRVDSGVEAGTDVSIHYDPMLAKVIAHGPTRGDAIRTLALALRRARIHGVVTNRELLVRMLEHEDFAAGRTDTGLLERLDPVALSAPLAGPADADVMLLAASVASQRRRRGAAVAMRTLPSGYRNNPSQLTIDSYLLGDRTTRLGYRIGHESVEYAIDGEPRGAAAILAADSERVRLRIDGVDRTFTVAAYGSQIEIDGPSGSLSARLLPRLPEPEKRIEPGSLLSPMPGKVVRVAAAEGERVAAGAALVVVEAMKMEHTIASPHDGVVAAVPVVEGQQVSAEQILAIVEPEA